MPEKIVPFYDHIYVFHGCPQSEDTVTPNENRWMDWLAVELKSKGYDAKAPQLPTPWAPTYESWKDAFAVFPLTAESMLIAHSCACPFLLRYLLEEKITVKKAVLVAPAKIPQTADDTRQDLYNFEMPEDGSAIAKEVVIFTSDDEFPHHKQSLELYKKALPHARLVEFKGKKHFLFFQMQTREFPELLQETLRS